MFRKLNNRAGHYALLAVAWAALCLPNLGGPSLWDIDEGNNAEAAREMWRAGNWIVPTCNYQMRVDKPALLYWLQATGYAVLGPSEFTARLPSALAALAALLANYELGRRMFNAATGLLAGLLLGAAVFFCVAAHFANPDALLNACSVGALLFFWADYAAGRNGWSPWSAAAAGLGVLAKGPVGLVLPAAVALLFLLWRRQPQRLWGSRLAGGLLVFLLVAAPWYVWVTLETHGHWMAGFFWTHNVDRFRGAMENHTGPFAYYLGVLLVGCAPWCVFLSLTAWYALRQLWSRNSVDSGVASVAATDERAAVQFLVCWIAVYFVFYSAAATKLPNYILPLYPAVALLTARCLDRWRRGELKAPAWLIVSNLICLALVGVAVALGLLVLGGVLPVAAPRLRRLPGVEWYAALGAPLVMGTVTAVWLLLRRANRTAVVVAVVAAALAFTGGVAAFGAGAVEAWKAPRGLALEVPADQTRRDVRVAAYAYFQPSLIFYCRREVSRLDTEQQALEFLQGPLPSYLFMPAERWRSLQTKARGARALPNTRHDLYDNKDVVVVTNE